LPPDAILASGAGTSIELVNSTIYGGTFSAIVAKNHATILASGCEIYRYFSGEFVVHASNYINEDLKYEVDVRGNFWINVGPNGYYLVDRIWDQNDDPNNKIVVNYSPVEGGPVPTEGTTRCSVKAMFRE